MKKIKKIELKKLTIENFKNIKKLELDFDCKNANISGANGSGKTTIKEAWLWLLFGKDSYGKVLNPKPFDSENKRIIGLEPKVIANVIIDGENIKLEKRQLEKWTKVNGSNEKTYTGLTNKHFIDDVPKTQTEWKAWLKNLIDEETFQVLSDTSFFMSDKFHFKKRREILISMVGVTDDDIINSNDDFKELKGLLKNKTLDDLTKQFKNEKKENNQNIKNIPIEIQTLHEIVADYENKLNGDKNEILKEIKDLEVKAEQQKVKVASVENLGGKVDRYEQTTKLNNELSKMRNEHSQNVSFATSNIENDIRIVKSNLNDLENSISKCNIDINNLKNEIKNKVNDREFYLNEWTKENAKKFDETDNICHYCGTELKPEKIEENKKHFNKSKMEKLKEIEEKVASLKASKDEIEEIENKINDLENEKQKYADDFTRSKEMLSQLELELQHETEKFGSFEKLEKVKEIKKEIDKIENDKIENDVKQQELIDNEKFKLSEIEKEIIALKTQLNDFEKIDDLNYKIKELQIESEQLKEISIELDRKINLIDEFIKYKMTFIQEKVNDSFELVEFKLFETQENGGVTEVCEPMYKTKDALVGYNEGLNNGARVLSDIDIISTVGEVLGYKIPLFVDNAESLTEPIKTDLQVIKLSVAKNKKLKFEVEQ